MKHFRKFFVFLRGLILFSWIKKSIDNYKRKKRFKKKLEELRKRDPFIYNH